MIVERQFFYLILFYFFPASGGSGRANTRPGLCPHGRPISLGIHMAAENDSCSVGEHVGSVTAGASPVGVVK